MALDGINTTQKPLAQHADLQLGALSQPRNANDYYATSIREGVKAPSTTEKFTEYFWKAWEYVQVPFVKAWEWIMWIVQCCPAEKTQLEIVEQIIADPKKLAKEFAENPAENVGELVMAALIDPGSVKEMRDKNKGAFGTFMKEFKRAYKEHAQLLKGKEAGIIPALLAFIDPTKGSGHDLFKALKTVIEQNPTLIFGALDQLSEQVLKIIGEEDKEKDNDKVKALRLVFNGYLPKVIAHAKENPEEFQAFFEELYKLRGFDGNAIVKLFQGHSHPVPDVNELGALKMIFADAGLALRQLADPNRYFGVEYKGAEKMDIEMAFYQCVLSAVKPDQIGEVIEKIGDDFPLVTAILQQAKDEGSNTLKKIAANLPEALKVLAQLHEDYQNPPKAEKK